MNAIAQIDFHGHTLVSAEHNSKPHVAMRPIVDAIGLDWDAQRQRIKRHPVLSTCAVVITVQLPGDIQRREVTFLPLSMLNGWLFGVDTNRVKPEIRDNLIMYQRECFDVLAAYWQKGEAVNPRKPRPKALPNGLSIEQQDAIKGLVKARVDALPPQKRAKAAITCWSSLKSKFGCTYKEIEPENFSDAVSLVARVPLEGEYIEAQSEPSGLTELDLVQLRCLISHCRVIDACFAKQIGPALRKLNSELYFSLREHVFVANQQAASLEKRFLTDTGQKMLA